MKNKIALIYHSGDADGYLSALVFLDIAKTLQSSVENITLFGYNYQQIMPFEDKLSEFTDIVFVDVTPPVKWLERLDTNQEVYIFDHHENAYQTISKLKIKNLTYIFDKTMSAAKLIAKTFSTENPNIELMLNLFDISSDITNYNYLKASTSDDQLYNFINKIDNFDTWKWWEQYILTNDAEPYIYYWGLFNFCNQLSTASNETIDKYLHKIITNNSLSIYLGILQSGVKIEGKKKLESEKFYASKVAIKKKDQFVIVGTGVNTFVTEIIEKEYPDTKFVIYFKVDEKGDPESAKISLRSIDKNFNVAKFAKFAINEHAGGHATAAGGYCKLDDFLKTINEFNLVNDFLATTN